MIETILQIEGQIYPFERVPAGSGAVRVEERQTFTMLSDLLEKKREMVKKSKLLESNYLIRLLNIYQEDLALHFIYEYVPYSLSNFIPRKLQANPNCGRAILKKISFELTVMISFLAGMRIELDLSVQNLGVTEDQKLKVFMSARCRMGHKSEVSLVAHYGHCKEKVLAFLEGQLFPEPAPVTTPNEAPNFVIRGNKLVFPKRDLNESIYSNGIDAPLESESCDNSAFQSGIFGSNIYSGVGNLSTASCINPNLHAQPSRLRHTQSPRFGRSLNFSQAKQPKGRNHKNSFQFGARKGRPEKYYTEQEDDNSDAKSFTHSRSIRIEFEQKFDQNAKKKRKDSCKLKITTFHQYEMDDVNPQELFSGGKQEQFFKHFAQKAEEDEREFTQPQSTSDLFSKKQPAEPMHSTTASSARINLQEKVRLAREKAENLLSRFLVKKPHK